MAILVCLDRDGTVNEDHNNYIGSSSNWRDEVIILDGVVDGIKLMNKIPKLEVFIVTNQAGVAIEDFPEFTEERMHEVNKYIVELLNNQGASVRGYFACPFVNSAYAEKARAKGRKVNPSYVKDDCRDLKPNIGMLEKAAASLGLELGRANVYVIGNRKSDVQLGLNAGGAGILVPSSKTFELGDVEEAKKLGQKYSERVIIAGNFFEAAKYIHDREFLTE